MSLWLDNDSDTPVCLSISHSNRKSKRIPSSNSQFIPHANTATTRTLLSGTLVCGEIARPDLVIGRGFTADLRFAVTNDAAEF